MKKLVFFLIVFTLTNCSIKKITTRSVVSKAQDGKKTEHHKYVNDKLDICKFLALNPDQKNNLEKLFNEEKTELDKIEINDMQMLARHIYKYESEFRKVLDNQQLKMYKKMRPQFEDKFFYSQYSLNKIRRTVMDI